MYGCRRVKPVRAASIFWRLNKMRVASSFPTHNHRVRQSAAAGCPLSTEAHTARPGSQIKNDILFIISIMNENIQKYCTVTREPWPGRQPAVRRRYGFKNRRDVNNTNVFTAVTGRRSIRPPLPNLGTFWINDTRFCRDPMSFYIDLETSNWRL